eukprot:GHVT01032871.1.p1 GENE.GHVT01032871.1~~GHVT01032871.1.p1  ORF type:complete len:244 (+),score=35.98 GHVT01032871.1:328-1059(+)
MMFSGGGGAPAAASQQLEELKQLFAGRQPTGAAGRLPQSTAVPPVQLSALSSAFSQASGATAGALHPAPTVLVPPIAPLQPSMQLSSALLPAMHHRPTTERADELPGAKGTIETLREEVAIEVGRMAHDDPEAGGREVGGTLAATHRPKGSHGCFRPNIISPGFIVDISQVSNRPVGGLPVSTEGTCAGFTTNACFDSLFIFLSATQLLKRPAVHRPTETRSHGWASTFKTFTFAATLILAPF